jgi:hypothetical protein
MLVLKKRGFLREERTNKKTAPEIKTEEQQRRRGGAVGPTALN